MKQPLVLLMCCLWITVSGAGNSTSKLRKKAFRGAVNHHEEEEPLPVAWNQTGNEEISRRRAQVCPLYHQWPRVYGTFWHTIGSAGRCFGNIGEDTKIWYTTEIVSEGIASITLIRMVRCGLLYWGKQGRWVGAASEPKLRFEVNAESPHCDNGDNAGWTVRENGVMIVVLCQGFLDENVKRRTETVAHEIGHALGLAHTAWTRLDIPVGPYHSVMTIQETCNPDINRQRVKVDKDREALDHLWAWKNLEWTVSCRNPEPEEIPKCEVGNFWGL